jgi:hypothetical protein
VYTGRVDKDSLVALARQDALDLVAGGLRFIGNDGDFFAY